MQRNLKTVPNFAAASPFTEGQIRWFVFNARNNGLAAADAVVRVGRRVYIDVDKFESWINSQNQQHAQAAA
jgi:hypothetical protein